MFQTFLLGATGVSPILEAFLAAASFAHSKHLEERSGNWASIVVSMKVCLAAALAVAFTATAMSQDSPAELLRELQAQKALLEEQRKELKQMTETQESMAGAMDSAWLVLCGALVMFMHAGPDFWKGIVQLGRRPLQGAHAVQTNTPVMSMPAGFAMLETGCCRAKNASNVLMKNLVTRWHFGKG